MHSPEDIFWNSPYAELLRSTPSLVLCCAWLVTMALHVHCGLGQLSPLPTSEDDKWVAAKHCGGAKRSRISDTHRLRSSLQFRYINNSSLNRPSMASFCKAMLIELMPCLGRPKDGEPLLMNLTWTFSPLYLTLDCLKILNSINIACTFALSSSWSTFVQSPWQTN